MDASDQENQSSSQALKAFVGGLAPSTTEEQLKEYFGQFGPIGEVSVMREKTTGRSRGFGFLTFENMESLEKSLVSPKHQLDGRTVEVKRAIPRGEVKTKSRKVFVGGVPPTSTNESLRECFSKYGPIAEAQIMKDRVRGRSRGFGFVTFEDDESVAKVLSVSEHHLDGKMVDVKRAEPKKVTVPPLAVGQAAMAAHLHASPNSSPRGSLAFAPVALNPYVPFTFVPYQMVNSEGYSSLGFTTPGFADANYLFPSPYTSPRGSFTVGENDLPPDFAELSMGLGRRFSHEFSGLSIAPPSSNGSASYHHQTQLSPINVPLPIGQQHIPPHFQQPPAQPSSQPLHSHSPSSPPSSSSSSTHPPSQPPHSQQQQQQQPPHSVSSTVSL